MELVRLLLDHGADPNIKSNGNVSAVNVAFANSFTEIYLLLSDITNQAPTPTLRIEISEISKITRTSAAKLTTLIEEGTDHPGAGSCFIDHSVPEDVLTFLDDLWSILPLASETEIKKKKNCANIPCSDRHYFCDAEGYFSAIFAKQIQSTFNEHRKKNSMNNVIVFPHMRFLNYRQPGSVLAPHVDLFKKDTKTGMRSTHTFILYLKDCDEGGETALLKELSSQNHELIAKVSPKRGRLLLFPHATPHEGREVISTPKLLLRGELFLH